MAKTRVGNKQNSLLNGEWGMHVRKWGKKLTSGIRRPESKRITRSNVKEVLISKIS